jgi:hypothetical protein
LFYTFKKPARTLPFYNSGREMEHEGSAGIADDMQYRQKIYASDLFFADLSSDARL